jgi:3-oxoacyl-[acyl-carrier-protein] synthase II
MIQLKSALAITGWGVVSPIGIGVEAFTEGFQKKLSGLKPVEKTLESMIPLKTACYIPKLEIEKFLGKKGTRSLDRTTKMAVVATRMALEDSGISDETERNRIGVVLGTSTGSIRSIVDFTQETLVQDRPYLVNPALFPNTVMNCAAGQCAIWHKLKGVNATISGGHLSGLLALRYADLTIRRGYADVLVTGCIEEFCEQSAWAYHNIQLAQPDSTLPFGEGCTMFIVESLKSAQVKNRKILAEILACEVDIYPAENGNMLKQAEGLARCIHRTLKSADVAPSDIWAVSKCRCGSPTLEQVQNEGLKIALANATPAHELVIGDLIGEVFSAAAGFQLAALLAQFQSSPDASDRYSLITHVASDGRVGCALIKS